MSSQAAPPQTNGVPPSSAAGTSQTASTQPTSAPSQPPQTTATLPSQSTQQSQQTSQQTQQGGNTTAAAAASSGAQGGPLSPTTTSAPRPRDARMIELLLTSQGVTAYEPRVPLMLLDFAYRHTSSILNDALHLAADPYTSHAGAKPSATAGAGAATIPGTGGDATVTPNAVKLAIAQRLHYQFRGGGGAGGMSKDWLQEFATQRNRTALPKVAPNEWGVRLPSERFVLSGTSWGLKEMWEEAGMEEDSDEEEPATAAGAVTDAAAQQAKSGDETAAMEGVEKTSAGEDEDVGGEDVEGGTMEDVFGRETKDEDTEMGESR